MNRKVLSVVLTLALLAGGVGLGIHLLHKEALAQVNYVVEIWDVTDPDPENQEWLTGADVSMSFDGGVIWEEADEVGVGKYVVPRDDYEGGWLIIIDGPPADGVEPEGNPVEGSASHAYLFWTVILL